MIEIKKAVARVVEIANGEIGYVEKASNAQIGDKTENPGSGNWTKYGAYFDAQRDRYNYYNGGKNGFDWCDLFVDWCFAQAFGIDDGRKVLYQPMNSLGAGCAYSAEYFRQNSAWISRNGVPQVGDQIFFGPIGDESHTGIVADVNAGTVWTVEGNASNSVMRKSYPRLDGNIAGYGRPNYALVAAMLNEPPTADTPIADDAEMPTLTIADVQRMIDKSLKRELGAYIETIKDIPHEAVRDVTRTLLDMETVDGGTAYAVNSDDIRMPYNILRAVVVSKRYTDKLVNKLLDAIKAAAEGD